MTRIAGALRIMTLDLDGPRSVSVYVPGEPPELVLFAGDGQLIAGWGPGLEQDGLPPVAIVGVHRHPDETMRLHEYSPGYHPARFTAHERFLTEDVRDWACRQLAIDLPRERSVIAGVSAGGELALALGLGHPFSASPGAGFRPRAPLPAPLPRTYLTAGTDEPFFADNARRWAQALEAAGADVVMTERPGRHGGRFWRDELAAMITWVLADVM
jgi:enterochelin esterase-like enzyme